MADLPTRDAALLLDMLLAARDARDFVDGMGQAAFQASRLHQSAVIRSLEVIGEAAGKVSAETINAQGGIDWRRITGMRHRLIHAYSDVSLGTVWVTVRDHVPPLIASLEALVPGPDAS